MQLHFQQCLTPLLETFYFNDVLQNWNRVEKAASFDCCCNHQSVASPSVFVSHSGHFEHILSCFHGSVCWVNAENFCIWGLTVLFIAKNVIRLKHFTQWYEVLPLAASHPSNLQRLSSHHVNMLECLEWFFRLTSASRSMFPTSPQPASTICVDYSTSGAHWLRSLPRRSCMPLWHPALTTVTLSSLGLRRSSPTSCNECWTRQLV